MKKWTKLLCLAFSLSLPCEGSITRGEVGWMTRYGGLGLSLDVGVVRGRVENGFVVSLIHLVDSDAKGAYSRFVLNIPAVHLGLTERDYRVDVLGGRGMAGSVSELSGIARSDPGGVFSIRKEILRRNYWINYSGNEYQFSADGHWSKLCGADGSVFEVVENAEEFSLLGADGVRALVVKLSADRRPLAITTEATSARFLYDDKRKLVEIAVDGAGEKTTYGFDYDTGGLVSGLRQEGKTVDRFTWRRTTEAVPRWKRGRITAATLLSDLAGEYAIEVRNEGNRVSHRGGPDGLSKLFRRGEL